MHFKLDENADPRWRLPLEHAGHLVSTVSDEALTGSDDDLIAKVCSENGFALITLDQGFAQIIHYPPDRYSGIIVLRHPKPTLAGMRNLVAQIAEALKRQSPAGELWIVEPGRIRIHQPRTPE
jgi:predicted nuclease of predicted toxin-antitoxin system